MEDLHQLVIAAQAGDNDAFEAIVIRLQDLAVGFAYSILRDFHLAEDAAQEAFINAFLNLHQLREPKAFLGWFRRIVFKHCNRLTRRLNPDTVPLETMMNRPEHRLGMLEALVNQEMKSIVLKAIDALSEKQRQAVMLFYIGGSSQKEIATFLSLRVATVNRRLQSARERLKSILSSEERIIAMVKETLSQHAPSRDDSFVNAVGIFTAAKSGDAQQIRQILSTKPELADTDYPHPVSEQKPIDVAAREGHREIVQLLLEAGVSPLGDYHYNHYVPCALSIARDHGHAEVIALIEQHLHSQLDGSPDTVSETDKYGNTMLFRLVYHSYWSLIPDLIDRGADVNHRNHKGERPIHRALYKWHGNSDRLTAGVLLSRGAEYDIWVASALGETHDVYRMLKADSNLANFHNGANHTPSGTSFPLAIAAREGHADVVRLLLEHGAKPNADNATDGFEEWGAPLVLAIQNRHFDVAHLLLDHGANPNTMIEAAPSAVDYALYSENTELADRMVVEGGRLGVNAYIQTHYYLVIGELLDRCPQVTGDDAPDRIDDSFLGNAAWQGEPNVVRMCLKRQPEISPNDGIRLLHNTLNSHNRDGDWKDYVEVIRQLLDYGVDPNAPHPERNGTLLHWLSDEYFQNRQNEAEMIEFAKIFLEYGANINARDHETSSTPLAWAARYGHLKYVEFLLSQGASPKLPDDEPETTPLYWAETQGYADIASVLRQSETD